MVGIILSQKCTQFCAHPTDRFAQLYTASHMLWSLLSRCFSAATVKTWDLFWMGLLPWAQEAPGSNPGAPTTNLLNSNLGTFGNNCSSSKFKASLCALPLACV